MAIYGVTSVFPVAIPVLAQATDSLASARKHLKTGVDLLNQGKYEKALAEFQKAYDLSGRPNPLVNIGTCYKAMGQPQKAIDAYRLFLEKMPGSPQQKEVEATIAELEKEIQGASSPPAADKYIPPPTTGSNLDLAKQYFKAGKSHYEKGEYGAALDEFQKSYGLIRILDTQYNIGLCYEKLGAYDKAVAALQLYVQGNPGKAEKEEAETRIAWIQSQIKPQKKEGPQIQPVAVVTPSEEQSPSPKPVQIAKVVKKIKKEKIRVPADETWKMPQEEVADTPPQRTEGKLRTPISQTPAPLVTNTYPPPANGANTTIEVTKKSGQPALPYRNLMWTSFALSAVSLTTGVIAHFAAKRKEENYSNLENRLEANGQLTRDANDHPSFTSTMAENENRSQLNTIKDEVNTRGDIAIAGFIGAGVFLGLGALFYKLSPDRVTLTGGVQANGGHVNMQVRF